MLSGYDVSSFATPEELNILNLPDQYHPEPDYAFIMFDAFLVNSIGFFDEQFFPCYFDDDDYSARCWMSGHFSKAYMRAPFYHVGSVTNESVPNRICTHEKFRVNQHKFASKWGAIPEKSRYKAVPKYFKYPYNNPEKTHYIPYPRSNTHQQEN
jgi:GT2 family glycosyltransferase